jgi:hypothetical protein
VERFDEIWAETIAAEFGYPTYQHLVTALSTTTSRPLARPYRHICAPCGSRAYCRIWAVTPDRGAHLPNRCSLWFTARCKDPASCEPTEAWRR